MVQDDDKTRAEVAAAFRERMIAEMERRGHRTPEDFARFAGVTKNTGYNWHGGGLPRAEALVKLVRASGISADYWLGLSDARQPPRELSDNEANPGPAAVTPQAADPERAIEIAEEMGRRARQPDAPAARRPRSRRSQ